MTTIRSRSTLIATAIAATLALAACGDNRDNATTTSSATPGSAPASTASSPYTPDRVTVDASTAAPSAGNTTASNAASSVEKAGDRAAAAAGDAALTAKVKAALMAEPGIDSLQIDVDTQNARVTLSGEVDTPQNRQRVLQVARNVDGVGGVVDRLSVKR